MIALHIRSRSTVWWWGNAMFLGFLALFIAGCAFLKSISRTAAVAGGGAGGALIGSAAGPAGTAVGAAAGAGVVYAAQENSELREGSLQGDGAHDAEIDRLKSLLMLTKGDLQIKERALAEVSGSFDQVKTWSFWILIVEILAGCAWFRWRNRHNFRDLGLWNGLLHSIFGGKIGKAIGH